MTRALATATIVAALVVAVIQQTFLVLAPVSMTVAAVVAGVLLGAMMRPREVRDVVVPGVVVGVVGMFTAALLMAVNGTHVLEPRFLLSWVVVAVLGLLVSGAVALFLGRLLPRAHA